jgi:hypothetical protein
LSDFRNVIWRLDPMAWEKHTIAPGAMKGIKQAPINHTRSRFIIHLLIVIRMNFSFSQKSEGSGTFFDARDPNQQTRVLQGLFQITANCNWEGNPSSAVGDSIPGSCDWPGSL